MALDEGQQNCLRSLRDIRAYPNCQLRFSKSSRFFDRIYKIYMMMDALYPVNPVNPVLIFFDILV